MEHRTVLQILLAAAVLLLLAGAALATTVRFSASATLSSTLRDRNGDNRLERGAGDRRGVAAARGVPGRLRRSLRGLLPGEPGHYDAGRRRDDPPHAQGQKLHHGPAGAARDDHGGQRRQYPAQRDALVHRPARRPKPDPPELRDTGELWADGRRPSLRRRPRRRPVLRAGSKRTGNRRVGLLAERGREPLTEEPLELDPRLPRAPRGPEPALQGRGDRDALVRDLRQPRLAPDRELPTQQCRSRRGNRLCQANRDLDGGAGRGGTAGRRRLHPAG